MINHRTDVRLQRVSIVAVLCLFLSACNSTRIYQDADFNPPVYWGYHTVQPGENISSIAWRYSRDYRELADANGLKPPFTLAVDQRIRLDLKGNPNAFEGNAVISSQPAGGSRSSTEVVIKPRPEKYQKVVVSKVRTVNGVDWQWPSKGKILDGFGSGVLVNKGVDIAGPPGSPIFAASDGRVVYAGAGVVGYGNLVILEHQSGYLSAYAHNESIFVNAGETVSRGMVIAGMGKVGTDRHKLHFEIRKNGQAQDPLNYLPR